LPRQLAIIADELAVDMHFLVPAIAPELRIRYQLERVYNIRRAARFLRARGKSIPPFPDFHVLPIDNELEPELSPLLPTSTQEMELYRPGDPLPEPGPPPGPEPEPAFELRSKPTSCATTDTWTRAELDDDDLIPVEVVLPGGGGGHAAPVMPSGEAIGEALDDLSLHAQLDDEPAPGDPSLPHGAASTGRETAHLRPHAGRRTGQRLRAPGAVGRIAIRKVAVALPPRVMAGATLGEATRANPPQHRPRPRGGAGHRHARSGSRRRARRRSCCGAR